MLYVLGLHFVYQNSMNDRASYVEKIDSKCHYLDEIVYQNVNFDLRKISFVLNVRWYYKKVERNMYSDTSSIKKRRKSDFNSCSEFKRKCES